MRLAKGHILLNTIQNDLRIQIKNNGTSFKCEYSNKVFNIFYNASNLSLVKWIGIYIVENALLMLE
ncbi:MAG TPA: hypothetical protein DCR46_06095 [Cytophagales bacterium]|nr:hypothetical protein [Cytophagales bacterium]